MDFTELAQTIREGRSRRGLTQQQLAELAKVSRMTIVALEKGATDARVAKLERILKELGLTLKTARLSPRPE